MGCPAPGPTMASTPKVGHGPNPAPNGGPNMPSTSNVGPASTPKVGPNTAPGTNIGYTNSDIASNIGPHPNAGPTGKAFTTPSGGPRLVTSTPKSSPAEPSLQFSNQSAVAPDSSKLDTLLDETEVAGQWETRELGRERTSINSSTNAGGRAASGNSHATNSNSANGSETNGSSHQTNANRNETNGNANASNANRTNSHATNAIRTNSCATNANGLATNTNNGAKPPSGLNRQARQNQSDLPGIHRSCVQKSLYLHSTNQNFTDGQNLNPTNTSTTDFQTDVSTAMDTMESGESNEESCVSGAQLPNNINERVNTYKNSNGNADRNSNDRNIDRNSNDRNADRNSNRNSDRNSNDRNADRNSNDKNTDRKSDRNARPPPLETTIDRVIDMQPISNRNIDSNPLPVLETTIDRPVDNQSISNRNINHGTASMDLNRNNLSTIDEFENFGPSGAGFVGSKFETFGPSTAGFGESTVDNSIYRNNDNERWSTFDYSGSISNNNLEESVATANSQLSGSGSSPGSGKSNVVAKNKRYHEMCTEL
ncbi:hypothetical protein M8J76_009878 [Diaphorina citri]|nr:hypothetical protein M8J76_009878 [Diaphorina citri]